MILDILNSIEKAKGGSKKKLLLQHKGNLVLQELWLFTYGRINLHTRKTVDLSLGDVLFPESYGKVVALLDDLRCKKLSGNALDAYIKETLECLHPNCIEVYNRVIKGNLRCGIGATVANTVWGKDFIEKFPVMLISPYCPKKAAKIMKGGAVLQLKSDGVRSICQVSSSPNGKIYKFFSRQGEEFLGVDAVLQKQISDILEKAYWCMGKEVSFDGELTYIDEDGKHQPHIASGIMNKSIMGSATQEELESLTYVVWDLYSPYDDDDYYDRLEDLQDALKEATSPKVILAETWPVDNLQQVTERYQEIVDKGNEGVVLKSLRNTWKDTRVTDCIKYKEKHQAEFRIVSHYLGESGKEFQNVLGGFHVTSECGSVLSKTGSGLSFEDRGILSGGLDKKGKPIYLKDADGNYIKDPAINYEDSHGDILTLEYNKRTKTKGDRETYSLRFPIVKQFRMDKDIANTLAEMIEQEEASRGLRL